MDRARAARRNEEYRQKTSTSYTLNQDGSHTLINTTIQEVTHRKSREVPIVTNRITTTTSINTKVVNGEIVTIATQKMDKATIEISLDEGGKTYSPKVVSNSIGKLQTIDVAGVKGDLKGFQASLEMQLNYNPAYNPFSAPADLGGDGNFVLGGLGVAGMSYDLAQLFVSKILPASGSLGVGIALVASTPWLADIYRKYADHRGRSAILKQTEKVIYPN